MCVFVCFQSDKKNGFVNVGELEGCVHFKIGMWDTYIHILDVISKSSQDSLLVVCQICDRKVAILSPGRSSRRIFFSRVNFCAESYSLSIPPMLLQWHVKDLTHSAKSADSRLHLNMHTPLTQWSQSGLNILLSRHSVGTYPEMSSHATCQGTFVWATMDWSWQKECS